MTFKLFMTLLDFVPETTELTHKGMTLGNYNGKESFWFCEEIENMKVDVKDIDRYKKTVVLEVL